MVTDCLSICDRPYWDNVAALRDVYLARSLTLQAGPSIISEADFTTVLFNRPLDKVRWTAAYHIMYRKCKASRVAYSQAQTRSADEVTSSPDP